MASFTMIKNGRLMMIKKWIDNNYSVDANSEIELMRNGDQSVKLMAAANCDDETDTLLYLETGGNPVLLHADMTTEEVDDFVSMLDAYACEVKGTVEKAKGAKWALEILDRATI